MPTTEPHIQSGCCTVRFGRDLIPDHIYHSFANPDDVILSYEEEAIGTCDVLLEPMPEDAKTPGVLHPEYAVRWIRTSEQDDLWVYEMCVDLMREVSEHNHAQWYIDALENHISGLSMSLANHWEAFEETGSPDCKKD